MAYTIKQQGSDWGVYDQATGDLLPNSCHATKQAAIDQLVAVMLSEEKAKRAAMSADAAFSGIAAQKAGDALPVAALAAFALDGETWEDERHVYRAGLLFELGDYPDKGFSLDEAEARAAIAAFRPVPLDIEHTPSILDRKLGEIVAIDLADDGKSLVAVAAEPKWLTDVLGNAERKVSATWDRATKTLQGAALVLNPRVADAALMAAFARSRHDTPHGQSAMQRIHDQSAAAGAVCKQPTGSAAMASSHEAKAIQQIHDTATEHGAACASMKPGEAAPYLPSYYSQDNSTTRPASPARREPRRMTLKERFLAFLGQLEQEGDAVFTEEGSRQPAAGSGDEPPPAPKPPTANTDPVVIAKVKQLEEQLAAQAAQFAENERRRIDQDAAQFAEGLIRDGKAVPAESPAIIAAFRQAAHDDHDHGIEVTFNVDKEGKEQKGSRLDAIRALFEARPKHILQRDLLTTDLPEGAQVLLNRTQTEGQEKKPSAERLTALLKMTPEGREVLKDRANGNGGGR